MPPFLTMQTQIKLMLPETLDARINFLLPSRTRNGNLQAKCSYVYNGMTYEGIIFSPDKQEWFTKLRPGQIVKAHRVGPCADPAYEGQYKGTALPIDQQVPGLLQDEVRQTVPDDVAKMPELLRDAANVIESLLFQISHVQKAQQQTVVEEPPFRGAQEWAQIISRIIAQNPKFYEDAFSAVTMNAYLEACFDDFWEGDLTKMRMKLPRWRRMVSRALQILCDCDFIEKVPGMVMYYRITKQTLKELF